MEVFGDLDALKAINYKTLFINPSTAGVWICFAPDDAAVVSKGNRSVTTVKYPIGGVLPESRVLFV